MHRRPQRPRLTLAIAGWGLVDVAGLFLFSLGAAFLARGRTIVFAGFPATTGEAIACAGAGLALMIWGAGRVLGEVMKQVPPPGGDGQPS